MTSDPGTLLGPDQIIARYARHFPYGRRGPMRCWPGAEEKRERREQVHGRNGFRERPGSDGKVIYDTVELAEEAAAAFALLGAVQRPYPCSRSRHGHYHLTDARPRGERD